MNIDKYTLEKQNKKKEKKYNKQIGACINTIMHLYNTYYEVQSPLGI